MSEHPMGRKDIAAATNIKTPTLSRYLEKLLEEGEIEQTGAGPQTRYQLKEST